TLRVNRSRRESRSKGELGLVRDGDPMGETENAERQVEARGDARPRRTRVVLVLLGNQMELPAPVVRHEVGAEEDTAVLVEEERVVRALRPGSVNGDEPLRESVAGGVAVIGLPICR